MTQPLTPSRRRFLSALGAGALTLPVPTLPGFVHAAGAAPDGDGNILVLIELAGGNDGLNTVVPITDPAYRGLRRDIGISPRDALGLDGDTGLHPAMRHTADLWEQGSLRIIEGVGYPNPNRSHFRSIEIWNAGQGHASLDERGWISSAFANGQGPAMADADGITLGGDAGPLRGDGRFTAMREEEVFMNTIDSLPTGMHAVRPQGTRSPLAHVMATYESAGATGEKIRARLEQTRAPRWDFPQTELGEQLRTAARLLEAGVSVPVLKVVQDGYDTHNGQPGQHEALLRQLSEAIDAFAQTMQQIGLWERMTVVTFSEFGRTAHENASGGTDHGTAAPVLIAGGAVAGGFGGTRVDLESLVDDDLVHTTDYRRVYAGLLGDLWGIDTPAELRVPSAPISILKT